jgi:hypothetical protein
MAMEHDGLALADLDEALRRGGAQDQRILGS